MKYNLYYYNDLITITKINIKRINQIKCNKGYSSYTLVFIRIKFTYNNKIKYVILEHDNIYF